MSARRLPGLVLDHNLVAVRQVQRRAIAGTNAELRLVLNRVHRIQRNALEVRAVVPGRLQARERKLRGNVLGRKLASARAGPAPFQQIERQKPHMRANLFADRSPPLQRAPPRAARQFPEP